MLIIEALLLFVVLIYFMYYYFTRTYKYWQLRNIAGPRPLPFFGNIKDFVLRKSSAALYHKQIYEEYPNEKVVGIYRFMTPSLIIRDLNIAKYLLIKDFEYFEDRGMEFSKKGLGANLFHADSEIWRPLRNFFSPLFSSLKMKNMVPLIVRSSHTNLNYLKQITKYHTDQDVYPLIKKFTMSSILACAFGFDTGDDYDAFLFEKMNKIDRLCFSRNIISDFDILFPGILKRLNSSLFPREVSDFFLELVDNIVQARNSIPSNRKDFIDLVLESKNHEIILKTKKSESEKGALELTKEVIAAQAFIFYIAGYETNATTMAFMMYELAMNPHIQEKLIVEVDESLRQNNGKITYDMISTLSYMDKVFNETLRKYPVTDIQRRAKANYKIPGTNIVIEKGTIIFVPTMAISYDEKYFPDPTKFDPDRFSPEKESERHSCAFIPFGTGPRYCIGSLFAKMQSRVYLTNLLSNFRVEASDNLPKTITFDAERLVPVSKTEIHLKLISRKT